MAIHAMMVLSVLVGTPPPVPPSATHAYSIVQATTIPILPSELRAFFDAQWSTIQKPKQSKRETDTETIPSQFILLDAAATGSQRNIRRAATRKFPQDKRHAKKFFRENEVKNGGRLPWELHQSYKKLKKSMKGSDARLISHDAYAVVELATLAATPFQTTQFCDTGSNAFTVEMAPPEWRLTCTDLREAYFDLLDRHQLRLRDEVRVAPQLFSRISEPADEIFRVLRESNDCLDKLADATKVEDFGLILAKTDDPQQGAFDYLASFDRGLVPIVETRLEEASLLAANLIGTAWHEAQRPDPAGWIGHANAAPDTHSGQSKGVGSLVASRESRVFHLPQCRHAKRIKFKNLVHFADVARAIKKGRRACQTCNPTNAP